MNEETRAMLTDISERLIKKFRESLEEELGRAVLPGTKITHDGNTFVVRYRHGAQGCTICHFGSCDECPREGVSGEAKCGGLPSTYLEKEC